VSRTAWYRRKNKAATPSETSASAAFLNKAADGPVPTGTEAAQPVARKQEDLRLATATATVGDVPMSIVPCWVFERRSQSLALAA
jgi:hypothetical protein